MFLLISTNLRPIWSQMLKNIDFENVKSDQFSKIFDPIIKEQDRKDFQS